MSHNTLEDHYQLMFALEYYHKYQTSEIDDWIVFEKDIRVDMLNQVMEQQKQIDKEF